MSISTYMPSPTFGPVAPQAFRNERTSLQVPVEEIPALAGTLVQLELLLRARTLDLETVTQLIRSDLGVALQVLRQSRSDAGDGPWRLSDCAFYVDLEMLAGVRPLCCTADGQKNAKDAYSEAEAFWKHAALVATIAEETAMHFEDLGVNPEQAYLAGLLHNIERLPGLLASLESPSGKSSFCHIQSWIDSCNLPSFINDVLQSARQYQTPGQMDALSRVVALARCWMDLCLPWSESCIARKDRFRLPLPQITYLVEAFFPGEDAARQACFVERLKHSTLRRLDEQRPEPSALPQPAMRSRTRGVRRLERICANV